MVMMPREYAETMPMAVRMVMEQRLTMAQCVPSRLPFPTADAV